MSQDVRTSLSEWQRRVKAKKGASIGLVSAASTASLESMAEEVNKFDHCASGINEGSSSAMVKDVSVMSDSDDDANASHTTQHNNHDEL